MRIRKIAFEILISLAVLVIAPAAFGDTLKFKNGTDLDGVIKKVEAGKVFVLVGTEEKSFNILNIESMDFNTPHLLEVGDKVPVEHFLKNVEAQEVVKHFEELEKTEAEVRSMLTEIRAYWNRVQPIPSNELSAWEMEKEEFRRPLNKYQEVLNDLYFHFLSRVDGYNEIAKEASEVYVGVRGVRIGSSLVPKDMRKLPLKKYVPGAWYDTIYFDGYNTGYQEAYEEFNTSPKSDN